VTEYIRWRGYHLTQDIANTGFDFHTVKSVVEYRAPLHFDDAIEVYVRLGEHGRSSLNWELAIFRQNEDQLLTTGEVVWVYVDMTAHKATRIPQELISKLAA
jgi:acyl-CoA thioester hydrolase